MDIAKKDAFDRLVAGLSTEERTAMLTRLSETGIHDVEISSDTPPIDKFEGTLTLRLKNETFLYRIILWVRALFAKSTVQAVYNDDVLTSLARKINREHPGLVNPHGQQLDPLFYDQLHNLKEVADFFKPYYFKIQENPGSFYVFLSSFIAPQISEQINAKADPYNIPDHEEPTNDIKNSLLKDLDEILKSVSNSSKANMYDAIKSIQWLGSFVNLPFLHFIAQFTDIRDSAFTCPYASAQVDYEVFASVLDNVISIPNNVLEAIFLFVQKKDLNENLYDSDIEKSVKKFMAVATGHLSKIKLFLSVVPIATMGKIIFSDYDWTPGSTGGGEDWFSKFRTQWRKIFEIRWNDFIRERKKNMLSDKLKEDFGLDSFPELPVKPWESLWGGVPVGYGLTSGFLAWYCDEKFSSHRKTLTTLIMEGVFLRNENRTEFTEALDLFDKAYASMQTFLKNIDPKGQYGVVFEELEGTSARTQKAQSTIKTIVLKIESDLKEISNTFCKSIRIMEVIFKGIFNENADGFHSAIQNLNTIKGNKSVKFKEELSNVRHDFIQMLYYLSEFEPIDSPSD